MKAPIALPDAVYHRLVDDLLHARDEFRIMELIGEAANIWAESALPFPEPERPDHQILATPDLGDRVLETATTPEKAGTNVTEAAGNPQAVWPPARPRPVTRGASNPPWQTPR